jgi:hypothetical protein
MKQIMALTYVDHPQVCSNKFFFMSKDFFYYIYKLHQNKNQVPTKHSSSDFKTPTNEIFGFKEKIEKQFEKAKQAEIK